MRVQIPSWQKAVAVFVMAAAAVVAMGQKKGNASSSPSTTSSPSAPTPPAQSAGSSAPVEVQMLAYGGLDEIMQKLATSVCASTPTGDVLVLDGPSLQNLQNFDAFYANAEALIAAFNQMAGASGAGGSGIDDFADITSAVAAAAAASTSETASSFTIADPTPALVLIHHLQLEDAAKCKVPVYAGVYGADMAAGVPVTQMQYDPKTKTVKPTPTTLHSVQEELNQIAQVRETALGQVPAPAAGAGAQQSATATAFNNLDQTYNTFLGSLSAPIATGPPLLSSVLSGFRLRGRIASADQKQSILGIYVSAVFAGGTQQDRKNLFTAIFTGDWIRYSGGVGVNVIVFRIAGAQSGQKSQILFTDFLRYRSPLEQISAPAGYNGAGKQGDNLKDVPNVIN